jgi:hypothetical protein
VADVTLDNVVLNDLLESPDDTVATAGCGAAGDEWSPDAFADPKSMPINPKDCRFERGMTGGHVTAGRRRAVNRFEGERDLHSRTELAGHGSVLSRRGKVREAGRW